MILTLCEHKAKKSVRCISATYGGQKDWNFYYVQHPPLQARVMERTNIFSKLVQFALKVVDGTGFSTALTLRNMVVLKVKHKQVMEHPKREVPP